VIKAPAMHHPRRARDALSHRLPRTERKIEPDEVKTRANPRDANDQMKPPDRKVKIIKSKSGHAETSVGFDA